MTFSKEQKYLIIADFEYTNILLSFKNKNPWLDEKIITKDQLLDLLSFSYGKDPLPYLLKKEKYDYSRLKKLLKILRVADISKSEMLSSLYQELSSQGYLLKDELGTYELTHYQILLFEADEDKELQNILSRNRFCFQLVHFSDFDFPKTYSEQPELYLFPDKFTQYHYLFSQARKMIVQDNLDPKKITFFVKDSDDYYLSMMADLFKLPVRLEVLRPLISDCEVKKAIELFYQQKSFSYAGEIKEGSSIDELMQLVKFYQLDELHDFDFAYSSLMEILSANQEREMVSSSGIRATNRLFFDSSYYFITDFVFDSFYKVFDDNNVLEDSELAYLGCNTSYDLTDLDKRKKFNYLTYNHVISASRVKLHLGDKIFDSQFMKEMNWKYQKKTFNDEGLFTSDALLLMKSTYKDDGHCLPDNEYKTYDHSYFPISYSKENHYSVSKLKTYYQCPFSYFCKEVLSLDDGDTGNDYFNASFGILVHKVFENIYSHNFDFEKSFALGVESFKKDYEEKRCQFTSKEEAWIISAKEDIHTYARNIHDQLLFANIEKEAAEKKIYFTLHSDKTGNDYPFIGQIDKIVYSLGNNGERYYTVVDYKTGVESFALNHVFLGGSLQLPLYSYALINDSSNDLVSGYEFAGFGIQHIFLKKAMKNKNRIKKENIQKAMALAGISLVEENYLRSFDSTALDLSSRSKVSSYLDLHYPFVSGSENATLVSNMVYTKEDLFHDAIQAAIINLDKISEADFKIAPVLENKNGKPACIFCKYRDICYRSNDDINDVSDLIAKKFSGEEENEEETGDGSLA